MTRSCALCFVAFLFAYVVVTAAAGRYRLQVLTIGRVGLLPLHACVCVVCVWVGVWVFVRSQRIINPVDERGRGSGDAFVEFDTPEAAQEAMSKNREHVGPRYVELFLANKDDIYRFMARHAERMAPSRDRYMSHGRYAHPPPPMADNGYHRGYAPRRHDDDRRGGFAMDRRPAERYDRRDGRHSGYDRGGRHPGREPRDRYDHGRRW